MLVVLYYFLHLKSFQINSTPIVWVYELRLRSQGQILLKIHSVHSGSSLGSIGSTMTSKGSSSISPPDNGLLNPVWRWKSKKGDLEVAPWNVMLYAYTTSSWKFIHLLPFVLWSFLANHLLIVWLTRSTCPWDLGCLGLPWIILMCLLAGNSCKIWFQNSFPLSDWIATGTP